ncbi:hypothetical protein AMATHDRAFT_198818 [Amanita thiersii Skay4041]|uniref:Peptidase C14 caspase domain-containing protein n=1 Tax=Amanita thiersii Skay4041 TaxID=703135 RepID=A0A2A9NGK6_9AGAR|nr:hypothetical protein AMATHDRAFT_198818 [Amanita thiersii Skay4041]
MWSSASQGSAYTYPIHSSPVQPVLPHSNSPSTMPVPTHTEPGASPYPHEHDHPPMSMPMPFSSYGPSSIPRDAPESPINVVHKHRHKHRHSHHYHYHYSSSLAPPPQEAFHIRSPSGLRQPQPVYRDLARAPAYTTPSTLPLPIFQPPSGGVSPDSHHVRPLQVNNKRSPVGSQSQVITTQAQQILLSPTRGVNVQSQDKGVHTGRKKALCIGINYQGQPNSLRGCINDARRVRKYLIDYHGFHSDDIILLTDVGNASGVPTRKNILKCMRWLVKDVRKGDSLFFHYSGHGGQVRDRDGDEEDGWDEVIYPLDFRQHGHITDDDMHDIMVKPLPEGCRLTVRFNTLSSYCRNILTVHWINRLCLT